MGTNFYLFDEQGYYNRGKHIGKRSAAGGFCWDCDTTLCIEGSEKVHSGSSLWHEACPKCKKPFTPEKLEDSAAGRELGFNSNPPQRKTGVRSCSSFNWAMLPEEATESIKIVDEYGKEYTQKQFLDVLSECPIQHFDSIGKTFS